MVSGVITFDFPAVTESISIEADILADTSFGNTGRVTAEINVQEPGT